MNINSLLQYVPTDRWRSLISGVLLPEQSTGACLVADISGLAALAEALPPPVGAEELARQINHVQQALISPVTAFRGAVIRFTGDTMLCWFDDADSDAALHAAQCALNMQAAMQSFQPVCLPGNIQVHLGLKITIATGTARRFLVGDETIQRIEILAGSALERAIGGQHLVNVNEVLLDTATVEKTSKFATIRDVRTNRDTRQVYSVLDTIVPPVAPSPLSDIDTSTLRVDQVKQWLLPPVYECLKNGEAYPTEMRPGVIFALRFQGIDIAQDADAGRKLDRVIRTAQSILRKYGAWLWQPVVDESSGYFYGLMDASADKNAALRAGQAALELRAWSLQSGDVLPVQTGVTGGLVYIGASGIFGGTVAQAARLMEQAVPGEILADDFMGRLLSVDIGDERSYRLIQKDEAIALTRLESDYSIPMIGRTRELGQMLAPLKSGAMASGQIIRLIGDAGIGKSRLVAEFSRRAIALNGVIYSGTCTSGGTQTAWHVWRSLLQAFFGLQPDQSTPDIQAHLETLTRQSDASLAERIPLLNDILALDMPESDFTGSLTAEERKSSLDALLIMLLRQRALAVNQAQSHLVLILNDAHWMDATSREFLERLAQYLPELPLLLVIVERKEESPTMVLEHARTIEPGILSPGEMHSLMRAKLEQQYPGEVTPLPVNFYATAVRRAEGNPFYIEALLNYLYDARLKPDMVALDRLPRTLTQLISGRIDSLTEHQRVILQAASIIGRIFDLRHLAGYTGDAEQLRAELNALSERDILQRDRSQPETIYHFRHALNHEAIYTSLAAEKRQALHEQFAAYMETQRSSPDLLAWHYGLSSNRIKQRRYFELAGRSAAARFASAEAVFYFTQVLERLDDGEYAERYILHRLRERVHYHTGNADAGLDDVHAMQTLAETLDDPVRQAESRLYRAHYARLTSDFAASIPSLTEALEVLKPDTAPALAAEIYGELAQALFFTGDFERAQARASEGLQYAQSGTRQRGLLQRIVGIAAIRQHHYARAKQYLEWALKHLHNFATDRAFVMADLANLAFLQSHFAESRRLLEEALNLARHLGNTLYIERTLMTLAAVTGVEGTDLPAAQGYLQEALGMVRRRYDRAGECRILNSIGFNALVMGRYAEADTAFKQVQELVQAGSKYEIALLLNNRGVVAVFEGRYAAARSLLDEAMRLRQAMHDTTGLVESQTYLAWIEMEEGRLDAACHLCQQAINRALSMDVGPELARAWYLMGRIALLRAEYDDARHAFETSRQIRQACGMEFAALEPAAGLALVAVITCESSAAAEAIAQLQKGLAGRSADGLEDAGFVYQGWWRALLFTGSSDASNVLETAYNLVTTRARQTTPAGRTTFLDAVSVNRTIRAAWQTDAHV